MRPPSNSDETAASDQGSKYRQPLERINRLRFNLSIGDYTSRWIPIAGCNGVLNTDLAVVSGSPVILALPGKFTRASLFSLRPICR